MYTPNNICVYVYAFSGCMAGLFASGKYPINATSNDRADAATKSDAFAQAVDEAWGSAGYTNADLIQIQGCCYGVWAFGRSPIADAQGGGSSSGYTTLAEALVLGVQAGTTQIESEGINPNGCGGGGGGGTVTTATVTGGETYDVKTTDQTIQMDSSNGSRPTAVLPASPTLGERHTFFWTAWSGAQVTPYIEGNGNEMTPWGGMQTSGQYVSNVAIANAGQWITYQWNGSNWIQVG